ncbi:MAG: hypothetical protein HFE78_08560 [Clostridiales bacterium]|nr:hypothetical protein [Clostridiales bacterium]
MIQIDKWKYPASWVTNGFEQTADILNGDDSGRLQGTKDMYLEYIGTFFNCSGTLHRDAGCTDAQWDELFRLLSDPENRHTIYQPFDQGTLVSDMYISKVTRKLIESKNGRNKWEPQLAVQFVSISSQWLAYDQLGGYMKGVQ